MKGVKVAFAGAVEEADGSRGACGMRWSCVRRNGAGDRDEELLMCDICDRGRHTFCLHPILVAVPPGPGSALTAESAWLPPYMVLVINDNLYGLMCVLSYTCRFCP